MVKSETIVLGGGCFWCLEALYQLVPGVKGIVSGYAGGFSEDPDYRSVCSGKTGHAEVVRVEFDPETVRLEDILARFWEFHDPTTPDRQGNDVGTQYRSAIYFTDETQRQIVEEALQSAGERFSDPIVTEVKPLEEFYPAEDYHQNYFRDNPGAPYCQFVIRPKVEKIAAGSRPAKT